jgi:hypothetical protein
MNLRDRIMSCFFKWVIYDPYPGSKDGISVYKAWRDGFDFAKKLVEKELDAIERQENAKNV